MNKKIKVQNIKDCCKLYQTRVPRVFGVCLLSGSIGCVTEHPTARRSEGPCHAVIVRYTPNSHTSLGYKYKSKGGQFPGACVTQLSPVSRSDWENWEIKFCFGCSTQVISF